MQSTSGREGSSTRFEPKALYMPSVALFCLTTFISCHLWDSREHLQGSPVWLPNLTWLESSRLGLGQAPTLAGPAELQRGCPIMDRHNRILCWQISFILLAHSARVHPGHLRQRTTGVPMTNNTPIPHSGDELDERLKFQKNPKLVHGSDAWGTSSSVFQRREVAAEL